MNTLNEGIVTMIAIGLPIFIDVSVGKEAFDTMGWIFIVLLIFCTTTHFVVIIGLNLVVIRLKIKYKCKAPPNTNNK